MKFTHITDCWNALEACTSLSEIKATIQTFPIWSGEWDVEVREVKGEKVCEVSNTFYDENTDTLDTDCEDYYDLVIDEDKEDEDEIKYEVPEYVRNIVKNIHSRGKVD